MLCMGMGGRGRVVVLGGAKCKMVFMIKSTQWDRMDWRMGWDASYSSWFKPNKRAGTEVVESRAVWSDGQIKILVTFNSSPHVQATWPADRKIRRELSQKSQLAKSFLWLPRIREGRLIEKRTLMHSKLMSKVAGTSIYQSCEVFL